MEKRRIGHSELEIAPLALGGNVFGWTADEAASFAVLDAFVDAGGTMIDTADVYSAWVPGHSGGESETVIGKWLKRERQARPGRDRDQGRLHGGACKPGDHWTGLRCLAAAARDRLHRPLLPAQGR